MNDGKKFSKGQLVIWATTHDKKWELLPKPIIHEGVLIDARHYYMEVMDVQTGTTEHVTRNDLYHDTQQARDFIEANHECQRYGREVDKIVNAHAVTLREKYKPELDRRHQELMEARKHLAKDDGGNG